MLRTCGCFSELGGDRARGGAQAPWKKRRDEMTLTRLSFLA